MGSFGRGLGPQGEDGEGTMAALEHGERTRIIWGGD